MDNIKRDPFETAVGATQLTLLGMGGALAAPSTAYLYDWNLLPIGQMLWMKELMTYKQFPALQTPSSYNLDQIIHGNAGVEDRQPRRRVSKPVSSGYVADGHLRSRGAHLAS